MLVACWSVKGGVGTSVVAASLALVLARRHGAGSHGDSTDRVLLVDLAGDLPAVLGLAEPTGPGVADWLRAGDDVPDDGLHRIEIDVVDHLALVPRGRGGLGSDDRRVEALAAALGGDGRCVVVDCGRVEPDPSAGSAGSAPGRVVAAAATQSVLVTRPCYLALRRAVAAPITPSSVVVVDEPGRALGASDVHDILGVRVVATVPVDAAVARAVDAGLLANRLPRSLERALRSAA